ncbi:MAG: hypothetical protein A2925_03625 [Candidatus Yanofskybacteria bacterium RIFCSPLOWO2_01_FULL_44_22]|uniref:Adenosine deaminase domain-containing protein n=1 Tax=Candidatus Yanofskybacteria bacterium RIFCSPLOWO2_01_FULL_44_22 TaxID=1802697 RepID=A0A1F8GNT5_9BACT|nr:MAG: hypothetical protein A2659_01300 [Candidatus Yanofskybacteria bacterium RIFCSPHIGHO2_01_FULL_44_24]OGN26650.1 MAG: hypothetical protein A2925_03625 [Candidatus Yanofskybacteria bacterium RIFCSPLOWO2_01_FULL_44_22]
MNTAGFSMDIETHIHLDGSRELLTILPNLHRITHGTAREYPFNQYKWSEHLDQVRRWFGNPLKGDIVKKFSLTTGVLQNSDTLYLAAYNFTTMRARKGFRYCEAIMAPQYSTFGGLTEKQVVEALIMGIKDAEKSYPEIEVNLLLAVGREVSPEEAVRLVGIYSECDRDYVVGVTLVCDEAKHPPEKHLIMYQTAKERGLNKACHVSEWVHDPEAQEADLKRDLPQLMKNARTALIDLGIERAEHFRILGYSAELMELTADLNVGVTMCPGSYLSTELIRDVKFLRIDSLLDRNLPVSLHSDDDLFMPNMSEMLDHCDRAYKFTDEQKFKLRLNAWKTRFGKRKPVPQDIAHLLQ